MAIRTKFTHKSLILSGRNKTGRLVFYLLTAFLFVSVGACTRTDKATSPPEIQEIDDRLSQLEELFAAENMDPKICLDYLDICELATHVCLAHLKESDPDTSAVETLCADITGRCKANLAKYCPNASPSPDAGTSRPPAADAAVPRPTDSGPAPQHDAAAPPVTPDSGGGVTVQGTSWYVDNAASSGSNDGTSWVNAWNSFAAIDWSKVKPGDGVFISGGSSSKTYKETLEIGASGLPGSPIIVAAGTEPDHDGEVIIDGGGTRQNGVYSSSRHHWKLYKLTVRNCAPHGDAVEIIRSDNVTIEGCRIFNPRTRGIKNYDGDNCLIKDNRVDTGLTTTNEQQDGIYTQRGKNNVIEGNTVLTNSHASSSHVDCFQANQETNLTVRNNVFQWAAGSGNNYSQTTMITQIAGYLKFYNNVCWGNSVKSHQSVYIGLIDQSWNADVYVWNNTISARHTTGTALRIANVSASRIAAIKNNILISPNGLTMHVDSGVATPANVDYNLLWSGAANIAIAGASYTWTKWNSAGFDAHGLNADPSLDGDLAPDSETDPSVDAGVIIAEFDTDINGTPRPNGSSWDIGAYEF